MLILAQGNAVSPPESKPGGNAAGAQASPAGEIGSTGPEGEAKRCAACGAGFLCGARCSTPEQARCWCAKISLSAAMLERLRAEYGDCLCEACLVKAASG